MMSTSAGALAACYMKLGPQKSEAREVAGNGRAEQGGMMAGVVQLAISDLGEEDTGRHTNGHPDVGCGVRRVWVSAT